MSKFTVIIPTMWRSELILSSVDEYIKSEYIDEIIIIDNQPEKKLKIQDNNKIKFLTKGYNIFVNPAWNWGVSESKNNNLIFANDDLFIPKIDELLSKFLDYEDSIIGLDYNKLNKSEDIIVDRSEGNMCVGFGSFFYLNKKNYINIPEDFKIFFGDVILYNSTESRYNFYGPNIQIKMSTTSNDFLDDYINIEKPLWKDKYKNIFTLK